jgi:hypothetical protein
LFGDSSLHAQLQREYPLGLENASDNEPPNSRVFVICGKNVTDRHLQEAFQSFGKIEYAFCIEVDMLIVFW